MRPGAYGYSCGIDEDLQLRLLAGARAAGVPIAEYALQILKEHAPTA